MNPSLPLPPGVMRFFPMELCDRCRCDTVSGGWPVNLRTADHWSVFVIQGLWNVLMSFASQ